MQNDVCNSHPQEENGSLMENCVDSKNNNFSKTLSRESDSKKVTTIISATEEDKNKPGARKKPKASRSVTAHGSITNFFGKSCTTRDTEYEIEGIETDEPLEAKDNSVSEVVKIDNAADTEKIFGKEAENKCVIEAQERIKKNEKSSKKDFTRKTKKKYKQMKRIIMPLDSESDGESNNSG